MGEDLTHYRVWDGMRAIDYLLTRPEVDKGKIGCAGHSGGGTLTRFIAAMDDRVKCAVINEGGVAHRWPTRFGPNARLGPSDVEQNLFPAALYGVDSCDQVVAFAPRPMLATIENFGRGFDEAAEHIKARYTLMGVPEKFAVEEAADPHSWTMKLRLASTGWFSRWFYGKPGPEHEPDFQAEDMKTLYCTPNGSIRYSAKGETLFTLMAKRGQTVTPTPKPLENASDVASFRREMSDKILKLTKCAKPEGSLGVRHLVTTPRKGYQVEKIEFLSEPGIYIPTWVFVPEKRNSKPATLWVSEAGKEAEGNEFQLLEKLTRRGDLIIAVDIRGIGETAPGGDNPEYTGPYGHLFNSETGMSYMTWFMDESLFGMRVRDVLRSVDYAYSRPDIGNAGLRVVGKGQGALWSLYAAVFEPRISSVIAQNGLATYRSLTQTDRYVHGADIFIRDVLLHYDLPHVAAAVADRPLTLVAPTDPMKNDLPIADVEKAYAFTAKAYRASGAAQNFKIVNSIEL
jgi:cephalosporin-C deacetylase-like acetyl esterase